MRRDMGENKRKRTVRSQIAVAIVGTSIVTMGLFFAAFQSVKGIIIRQYSKSAEKSVHAASGNLDYTLQDIENLSKSILFNHELMGDLKNGKQEQFISQLTSYYNSYSNVEGIYVGKDDDFWYVGSNLERGEESFRQESLKDTSGEIIWMPTREVNVQILSGRVPRDYFAMARKIVEINSLEEIGYLCVEVDERILQETYAGLREDGSEIYIMDVEGNMISSSSGDNNDDHRMEYQPLTKILESRKSGVMEYMEKGKEWVAIYSPLNQGHWRIIKAIPKSILYSEIDRLQMWVLIGSAHVFLLVLLAGLIYTGQITKPIAKLKKQMKVVESGDFSVRTDTQINNELGDLGESFNHMIEKVQELMNEVVASERNKNELELEVLHAQINPHFLYNTLNTIRWMAKIKGEDSISNALVALVKLLRVSISLGKNLIPLHEEVDYIENYLLIQRLRFNQRFQICYGIRAEDQDVLIPKLILQPIVENSLIYGVEEIDEEAPEDQILTIKVFTESCEDGIRIVVDDNGPGIQQEVLERIFKAEKNINKFSKVGLNNVNQRIKMYFGENYGLEILSVPGEGTKVMIHMPHRTEWEGDNV